MSGVRATSTAPVTRDVETWYLYLLLAIVGFQQSVLGSIAPFLRDEMALGKVQMGWHFSAYALGLLTSGKAVEWASRHVASERILLGSVVLMAAFVFSFAVPMTIAGTLSCAFLMGLTGGAVQVGAQAAIVRHHGANQGIALTEATVLAALGVFACPLVIGLAVRAHLSWRDTLIVPAALLLILLLVFGRRGGAASESSVGREETESQSALPTSALVALGMILLGIATEWGIGFWGSQFLETRLGVDPGTGVALMAGFFGGTLLGRLLASRLLRVFSIPDVLVCVMAGGSLSVAALWAVPLVPAALAALVLAGMCLGNFFPLILSIANQYAPHQPNRVSSGATQAVGLALLVVPVVLGGLGTTIGLVDAVGLLAFLPLGMICLLSIAKRLQRAGTSPSSSTARSGGETRASASTHRQRRSPTT